MKPPERRPPGKVQSNQVLANERRIKELRGEVSRLIAGHERFLSSRRKPIGGIHIKEQTEEQLIDRMATLQTLAARFSDMQRLMEENLRLMGLFGSVKGAALTRRVLNRRIRNIDATLKRYGDMHFDARRKLNSFRD